MDNNKIENFRDSLTQVCHALEAVYSEGASNLLLDQDDNCFAIYVSFPDKNKTGHTYKFSCKDITSEVKTNMDNNSKT